MTFMFLAQAAEEVIDEDIQGLTTGGVIVMTLSIVLVLGLLGYCLAKILGEPHPETHHHAPLDIEMDGKDG